MRVASGSTIARAEWSRREAIPVFTRVATGSNTAMPVHSAPVPHVVGHATWGGKGLGTKRPSPSVALTCAGSAAG